MSKEFKTNTDVLEEIAEIMHETANLTNTSVQEVYIICKDEMPPTFEGAGYEGILNEALKVREKINRMQIWTDEFGQKLEIFLGEIRAFDADLSHDIISDFSVVQNMSMNTK